MMWVILGGWAPPFPYRLDYTPPRDIDATVEFQKKDEKRTEAAKEQAARQVRYVYTQDATGLVQLRAALKNAIAQIGATASLKELPAGMWAEFCPPPGPGVETPTKEQQQKDYKKFHEAFDSKEERAAFEKGIDQAFSDLEQKGMLEQLDQKPDEGNQTQIDIGSSYSDSQCPFSEVRFGEAVAQLHNRLNSNLSVARNCPAACSTG